jgi:predicted MFS family arabinose efflux permease
VARLRENPFYSTLAGFCMVSMGLCLCRYAYAPLVPAMIAAGWVDKAGAGYLGGFNALGYLGGAVAAIFLPARLSLGLILRASIVTVLVSLVMSGWNLGFAWLAAARMLNGLAGAVLVIHAPSLALAPVPQRWKKLAGGAIFAGAGATIMMISLALPGFLEASVGAGWLFEAAVALVAGTAAWPLAAAAQSPAAPTRRKSRLMPDQWKSLFLLGAAYFLAGVGITPHTLFLTDYLHRDLHMATASSIYYYSLIGLGSFCGALAGGAAARVLGTGQSLSANYLLGTAAVVLVLTGDGPIWISLSVFGIGFFLLACVVLSSQRTAEIAGAADHPRYWGFLTLTLGAGITIGSYALAWLIDVGWSYRSTFVIAALSLALGLLLSLGPGLRTQQPAADS